MKEREARREGKTREEGSSGMRDQVAHAPRLPELTNPDDGGCPEPLSIQHCLVCCLCSCVGKELAVTRERPTNNAADALQEVMKNRLGPVDSHAACWSVDPPAPLDCFLLFDHGSSHCPLFSPVLFAPIFFSTPPPPPPPPPSSSSSSSPFFFLLLFLLLHMLFFTLICHNSACPHRAAVPITTPSSSTMRRPLIVSRVVR